MAPVEDSPKRQRLSPPDLHGSHASSSSPATTSPEYDDPSKRSSWYTRTWPRKAVPITQIAKESISSASNAAAETASIISDKVKPIASRKSSLALTIGQGASRKSLPLEATTTRDHAMPNSRKMSNGEPTLDETRADKTADTPNGQEAATGSKSANDGVFSDESKIKDTTNAQPSESSSAPRSWIGWLAGPGGSKPGRPARPAHIDVSNSETVVQTVDSTTDQPATSANADNYSVAPSGGADQPALSDAVNDPIPAVAQRRSWLPIWNNAIASQSAPQITSPPPPTTEPDALQHNAADQVKSTTLEEASDSANQSSANQQITANKPTAWVFWSRDKPAETSSLKDSPRKGELAVAHTDSQNKPRRASMDVHGPIENSAANVASDKPPSDKVLKRAKEKSRGGEASQSSSIVEHGAEAPTATTSRSTNAAATAIAPAEAKTSRPASPFPAKKQYDHLLLPSLHNTLKPTQQPTLLQQLASLFYTPSAPRLQHLTLVKDLPRIRQALAIGVHGYFPTPLIQSVLGRPTGTSLKFATMAASAITRYTSSRGFSANVRTAALEGEGRISERIDLLWKLLLNWIDDIRKSDFVLVACHSQGVPVAIMLVAKLIHFGCISPNSRVGVCAMAGVNLGPFPDLKSRFISGSAGELFEFSDPTSKVSKDYHAALDDVLRFGVRITYVGSIDDQLVSLESSVNAPVTHPGIFRAVSIDSRIHAPSFLSHLVGFALKLRNLGVQDHGLIRELSGPLAGSLYSGEGHSRLYEDDAIYDLAVAFSLETSNMSGIPMNRRDVGANVSNPYILPFAMRGILEEDFVKSELEAEVRKLLDEFDEWKPTTKALRDVKFRLEGIRSKL